MHGGPVGDHIVQLFDTSESLVSGVSEFVAEGVAHDAQVLVVARPHHWRAIASQLANAFCSLAAPLDDGRLMVLDAEEMLGRFLRDGRPDARLFDASVGEIVRGLIRQATGGARVYGELVDILADDGNFIAAAELEELWNGLGREHSFTLFCGYASSNFASLRGAPALPGICRAHTRIKTTPGDVLGMFLTHGQASAGGSLRSP